jgi:hypothetical protein
MGTSGDRALSLALFEGHLLDASAESLESLARELRTDDARDWVRRASTLVTAEEPADDGLLRRPGNRRKSSLRTARALDEFLAAGANDLGAARAEARAGARQAFGLVVTLGVMTFLAALIASVLAVLGHAAGAWTATAFSGPSALVTGLFYRLYLAETRRADAIRKDLQDLERARVSFLLATGLTDGRERETVIETIVGGLTPKPGANP